MTGLETRSTRSKGVVKMDSLGMGGVEEGKRVRLNHDP